MPRLKARPPKYSRFGNDKARCYINGKQVYLGKYGSEESKRKYNRLISEWREKTAGQTSVADCDRWLIAELATNYIAHVREFFGPGHNRASTIIPIIKRFGLAFADRWCDEFTPGQFKQARKFWVDAGCSRNYVNDVGAEIIRMFSWAVESDKCPSSVPGDLREVRRLKRGRNSSRESETRSSVPLGVVRATLSELSPKVQAMVLLQVLTGMRPGEVVGLRPKLIDRTGEVWTYEPTQHKTAWKGKRRIVFFGPEAQAIIKPYLFQDEPFAYQRCSYRQQIRRAIERINRNDAGPRLPHWTPQQLRKLAAEQVRAAFDLEAAQTFLGHSSKAVTERYYAQPIPEKGMQVAKSIR
jgi:integrase